LSPTFKWIIISSFSVLLLLLLSWLIYRAFVFRRLWRAASEYLAFRDVEAALDHVDRNPFLLAPSAEALISALLDRAWGRGDTAEYVSGAVHLSLLVGCRKLGLATIRQTATDTFQARLDMLNSPAGQRALELLGQLAHNKEMSFPEKDADQDLLEAMSLVIDLMRPLAANEATIATMDAVLDELRQIVRRQAGEV
jgi:hypothetical protein